ncbi:NADH-quinone oxidoreductase subunit N, partial [Micromonospora sp. ATA51]|nr:NADH-quinone oxidoreductase subunit N [Micromonospora sp. ATA51]
PADADGGTLDDLRGAARRHPWVGGAFALALIGLAGLPPGLAGLFAKVTVVRSLLDGHAGWLALVVAVNAVLGLAYYLRLAAGLWAAPDAAARPAGADRPAGARPATSVGLALAVATLVAVVVGFAPQLLLDLVAR